MVNISQILATKEDLLATREDLHKEIAQLRVEMTANKAEMIKWMFLFWIGQVATTFGFILLFMKK